MGKKKKSDKARKAKQPKSDLVLGRFQQRIDPNITVAESLAQLPEGLRGKIERGSDLQLGRAIDSLDHLSPELRKKMVEANSEGSPDYHGILPLHEPLTNQSIATALVDEMERRGHLPLRKDGK